jgi:hypothetical protein
VHALEDQFRLQRDTVVHFERTLTEIRIPRREKECSFRYSVQSNHLHSDQFSYK